MGWRRSPLSAISAGIIIGVVQAAIFVGYLHSARPQSTGADRGFGDWNIVGEAGWLVALLVASVALVATTLFVLRVRHAVLLTFALLAVETVVAGYGASLVPGDSDWRALVAVVPLTLLLVGAQRLSRVSALERLSRR